jgi:hypothetical protein
MNFQVTAGTKQSWIGANRVMARVGMALGVVALVGAREAGAQDLEARAYVDTNSMPALASQPEPGATSPPAGSPGSIGGAVGYDDARCL